MASGGKPIIEIVIGIIMLARRSKSVKLDGRWL